MNKKLSSPFKLIAGSFILLIIIGTLLLRLPISTKNGYDFTWLDAFFTSTSAVTITGLSSTPVLPSALTTFGKIVLMLLIQIGGLSVITITVFILILFGSKINISNRFLIKENLNQNNVKGIVKLVKNIIFTSLIIEFFGFLINLIVFLPKIDSTSEAIFVSIFHSISAFNNAGFTILRTPNGVFDFKDDILFSLNTSLLVFLGALGYIVIEEVIRKKSIKRLSIHSTIVIYMSIGLVLFGTLIFRFFSEANLLQSFLLSVNLRTSGFSTFEVDRLGGFALVVGMILMFIGGVPSSTAGGIKTTTTFILYKSVVSYAKGDEVIIKKRKVLDSDIRKAFVLFIVATIVNIVAMILFIEIDGIPFERALFESINAFSNTGQSTIYTYELSNFNKIVLCLLMFMGRIGPMTILGLFTHKRTDIKYVDYIETKMIIG